MTAGNNEQRVRIGDIVLVHDDTPRIKWKLAVIEGLNKGSDGLVRSANIRTANGKTNRPIARLYPLEVTAAEPTKDTVQQSTDTDTPTSSRPVRDAARKSRDQVKQWTQKT